MEANRNFANKLWNAGRYVTGPSHQFTPLFTTSEACSPHVSSAALPFPSPLLLRLLSCFHRYLIGNLQSLPAAEVASLAVTTRWTESDMANLPLPERYIVSRAHDLVGKVTAGLENYDMVRVKGTVSETRNCFVQEICGRFVSVGRGGMP